MTRDPFKFGCWVPNVSGGLAISNIEQRKHRGSQTRRTGGGGRVCISQTISLKE